MIFLDLNIKHKVSYVLFILELISTTILDLYVEFCSYLFKKLLKR
jgi:hypothetical protein